MTDIRCSSPILTTWPPDTVRRFIFEFSALTYQILSDIVPAEEYHVNNFLGDGFLIFLSERDERDLVRRGPERAVRAARRMRREFDQLCESPLYTHAAPRLPPMRLLSGIAHGEVIYGPFAASAAAVPRSTGMTSNVVLCSRFVKARLHGAESGSHILVCEQTEGEVRAVVAALRAGGDAGLQSELHELRQIQFQRRELNMAGLGAVRCFEVVDDPPV